MLAVALLVCTVPRDRGGYITPANPLYGEFADPEAELDDVPSSHPASEGDVPPRSKGCFAPDLGATPSITFSPRPPGKLVIVLRGEAFRSGDMLVGLTDRNDSVNRTTDGYPPEQMEAFDSVEALLADLNGNSSWRPSLFVDAVVNDTERSQLLLHRIASILSTHEPEAAAGERVRISQQVVAANSTSKSKGQMLGWLSTLRWIDQFAPFGDADV